MAKDKISDYSSTANSNTDIAGINIDEGCAPSGINDAIRTLMAQLKTWQSGGQDVYIHPAGTAAAPSITATGDTNTGVFFPAADTVGISTGGTERARVDSSGNLGLGVTPSAWSTFTSVLQVKQAALISYNNNTYLNTNAYYDGAWKYINSDHALGYAQENGVHYWNIAASGTAPGNAITFTQAMTLDASGNLGVGATSPSAKLDVQVASGSQAKMRLSDSAGRWLEIGGASSTADPYFSTDAARPILFKNGTSQATQMTLDASGNLIIGNTTNSSFSTTVRSYFETSNQYTSIFKNTYGATGVPLSAWNTASSGTISLANFYIGSGTQIGSITASTSALNINGPTAGSGISIDTSGNLLVGATSVGSYTSGIVVGNSSGAKAVTLPVNGGGATFNGVDTVNSASSGFSMGHITTTAKLQMRVGSTGGVELASGGTSWSAISDERLKDIIEPIENAAAKVSSLRAVIGKYKADEEGTRRSFLIAQDVQTVLPEAVSTTKIAMDDDVEYLGVSYTDTIPLLVAAIKEQQAIITQLQADVAALKG